MIVTPPDPPRAGSARTEMEIRVAAAQATLDRFRDKPFDWGKWDCAKMAAFHLRQMGRPVAGLSKAGSYKSAVGARAALKRLGYADLPSMADALFPSIAPAEAWVGDLLQFKSDNPLGALGIYLGNQAVIAYPEEAAGAVTARIEEQPIRGWRVRG